MSDHVILSVDRLIQSANPTVGEHGPLRESTSANTDPSSESWGPFSDEEEAANGKKQCRICHEEDDLKNLEAPCSCKGTMKLAHRECILRWIAEKLDNTCEICLQPYEGYPRRTPPAGFVMDTSEELARDAAVNASEITAHQLFDGSYDECATAEGARTAFLRAAILIPIAFMMLKHAYDTVDSDDQSFFNVINVFCLHLVTVLAPLYVVSWLMHLWLRRKERIERARLREQFSSVGTAQGFSAGGTLPGRAEENPRHV